VRVPCFFSAAHAGGASDSGGGAVIGALAAGLAALTAEVRESARVTTAKLDSINTTVNTALGSMNTTIAQLELRLTLESLFIKPIFTEPSSRSSRSPRPDEHPR
jgi:hypothetical protein